MVTSALAGPLPEETDVLVVGGGPTGLAAMVELGRRGVHCTVVEPRVDVSGTRPRAKTTSIRTMEHFRRWGLARTLREASYLPVSWSQDIVFCVNLLGPEVARFTGCFGMTTERDDRFAETSQQVPQFVVEGVLREAVGQLPACRTAFGWRATGVVERDDDVLVELRDGDGRRHRIASRYVVGCDGAASVVRGAIGAAYRGSVETRQNVTAVFRAPGLAERVPHGAAIQYWVLQPGASAYMGRLDLDDRWWIGLIDVGAGLSDADVCSHIEAAVGGSLAVELIGTDPWVGRTLNADRYATGRVLLAGDAAHLNPPWGGHGFNTGIGDAVNGAWKVAAALEGWGGPHLVGSYAEERRPVVEETIALAGHHANLLSADFADPLLLQQTPEGAATRRRAGHEIERVKHDEFHALGLVLGYHYEGSAIVCGGPRSARPLDVSRYRPTAAPGHRLPHAWLAPGVSLYDRLGEWFTVVRTGDGDPGPLAAAAATRGLPVTVLDLRRHGLDLGAPLVLVRPDQHVAWRGDGTPEEVAWVVDTVRGARAAAPAASAPTEPVPSNRHRPVA
ncbi:MAG: FAD-dependent monooxygenase [Acidimicrobiales bacterium]